MRGLLLVVLLVAGCRPADGGSQSAPGSAASKSTAAPVTPSDTARINALLERADAGRIQGSPSAAIWVVEISDFQCPVCKRWHDEVYPVLQREYIVPGHVRLAYVNLPLSMHQHAPAAAEAGLCASAQNKFWPMHDKLFASQERWAAMPSVSAFFDSLAVATGVNASEWRDCMKSAVMRRIITADQGRASASGVRSTPTFFVGNEAIQGAAPIADFRAAIERARAKAPPSSRPPQ
jgi:protein-disulfide isomerase